MRFFLGAVLFLLIHCGVEHAFSNPVTIEVSDAENNFENFDDTTIEVNGNLEKFDPGLEDSTLDISEAELNSIEDSETETGGSSFLEENFETDEEEEEEFEELSDEEKDHVLELIESGELDIKDVDPRDLPSRDRVTPPAFNSFDQATQPLQDALNFDGVTNAGQGVIDAQIALLTALSQPFVTAGNRFVDVNRELLGIASNAGNRFGETGQNVGRLVNEGFQPFVQTGNNLFELGSDTLEAPLQSFQDTGRDFVRGTANLLSLPLRGGLELLNTLGAGRQPQAVITKKLKKKKAVALLIKKKKAKKIALLAKLKKKKLVVAALLKKKKAKKFALLKKLKLKIKAFIAKKKAVIKAKLPKLKKLKLLLLPKLLLAAKLAAAGII
jgi:hypothetical protein